MHIKSKLINIVCILWFCFFIAVPIFGHSESINTHYTGNYSYSITQDSATEICGSEHTDENNYFCKKIESIIKKECINSQCPIYNNNKQIQTFTTYIYNYNSFTINSLYTYFTQRLQC